MKLGLQIVLGVFSLIPLFFAITGIAFGAEQLAGEAVAPALDNQYRYVSAIYLMMTFLIWYIIPGIERHGTLTRLLVAVFVLGGLARAYSMMSVGAGDPTQTTGMYIELCTPVFAIWQWLVARKAAGPSAG